MTNNTININRYLQNEMEPDEKALFESELKTNPELGQEVSIQKQLIKAAVNAGIKKEFRKAIRKRSARRKMLTLTVVVVVVALTLVIYYNNTAIPDTSKRNKSFSDSSAGSFISPPDSSLNVPFANYFIDGEKGGTIYHYSGSVLYFPPLSVVDENGQPVKGNIQINYREFSDPLDFFVSGIPMDYDSAGKKYNFESSGMCEINAVKDGKNLYINQAAQPVINLSTSNENNLHNLYFLDTMNRRWEFLGKDKITAVKDLVKTESNNASEVSREKNKLIKPVAPIKRGDNPVFSIEIEPGSFEELLVYNGVKMEVIDESNYRRSDAEEHWDDMKLEHSSVEGIYNITFINSNRKVTYKVRPVLSGNDYDAALKIFNQQNVVYQQALKNRITSEKSYSDSISSINKKEQQKWETENNENNKLNAMILERNKYMRKIMELKIRLSDTVDARQSKLAKEAAKQFELLQEELKKDQEKYSQDLSKNNEIIRSFSINRFGIWNCDHPMIPNLEIPLFAKFETKSGKELFSLRPSVVYKGFNGITSFTGQVIRVIPGTENMIWSYYKGIFYYFSFQDFAKADINKTTKSFTFKMEQADQPVSSYEELRKVVEKL